MDFTPSVLGSGRIIYTRWEYVDRPACPIQKLWTINPDGTGLAGFYGNRVLSPGTFMDAQPIPNTNRVIATATNHNGPCRGGIVTIDPTQGANSREAVRNLTPEIDIYAHRVGGGPYGNGMLDCGIRGAYEKPRAIDEHRFLVSKGGVVQIRDVDAHATSLLGLRDGMGFYSPQPVRKRTPPPVLRGTVMDHDAELPEDGSVSGNWATVFMQDVYHGLEPYVKRGEIREIVVVQEIEKSTHSPFVNKRPDGPGTRAIPVFGFQFPLVSCGATYAPKKVWGMADVGEDGSAAFRVPSEVPIYFLALDAEGRAVQRMRTFTHLMPGEVQGCVGCHADRNSVVPRAEKLQTTHIIPQELRRPAWGVKGFSYSEVVQGVLDRHCIQCHNEREQPAGVDLTGDMTDFFNVSYDVLCRTGTQGGEKLDAQWQSFGGRVRPSAWKEPLCRVDLDDQWRRDERFGDRAPALGQSGEQADRDPPQRAPGQRRQAAGQRVRRGPPPRVSLDGPEHPLLRHVVLKPQGTAWQPEDDAAGPRLDAQRSRIAPLRGVPRGGRAAEVLHPRDEAREEQFPPGAAGQDRRRYGEVRQAGLSFDRRPRLPESPSDVRADPRAAEGATACGYGGVPGDV
jgi:hypothetical protein